MKMEKKKKKEKKRLEARPVTPPGEHDPEETIVDNNVIESAAKRLRQALSEDTSAPKHKRTSTPRVIFPVGHQPSRKPPRRIVRASAAHIVLPSTLVDDAESSSPKFIPKEESQQSLTSSKQDSEKKVIGTASVLHTNMMKTLQKVEQARSSEVEDKDEVTAAAAAQTQTQAQARDAVGNDAETSTTKEVQYQKDSTDPKNHASTVYGSAKESGPKHHNIPDLTPDDKTNAIIDQADMWKDRQASSEMESRISNQDAQTSLRGKSDEAPFEKRDEPDAGGKRHQQTSNDRVVEAVESLTAEIRKLIGRQEAARNSQEDAGDSSLARSDTHKTLISSTRNFQTPRTDAFLQGAIFLPDSKEPDRETFMKSHHELGAVSLHVRKEEQDTPVRERVEEDNFKGDAHDSTDATGVGSPASQSSVAEEEAIYSAYEGRHFNLLRPLPILGALSNLEGVLSAVNATQLLVMHLLDGADFLIRGCSPRDMPGWSDGGKCALRLDRSLGFLTFSFIVPSWDFAGESESESDGGFILRGRASHTGAVQMKNLLYATPGSDVEGRHLMELGIRVDDHTRLRVTLEAHDRKTMVAWVQGLNFVAAAIPTRS